MISEYPIHYSVERPQRFTYLQLLVRVVAFCALGAVGLSFGTLFVFAYLALPVLAVTRLVSRGDTRFYVVEDGPRIVAALRWIAAISAWAGLVTDQLPSRSPAETVRLTVESTPEPTPTSAIMRVLTGLPSALVLGLLCSIGVLVWLWAAVSILLTQQVGQGAFDYLVGLQRWSIRLLAYQASLVDEYPPFSFADSTPRALTVEARAA